MYDCTDFPSNKFYDFERNVDRCRDKNFRNRFLNVLAFIFQKTQKFLTKFQRLATSGRHNYAMITDRRKFTTKWSLCGMSSFNFYR